MSDKSEKLPLLTVAICTAEVDFVPPEYGAATHEFPVKKFPDAVTE